MRPRILLRTHYQADEPRVIIAAATKCASPTESRTEDAVAARLKRWATGNQFTLSLPGATYAVGNARALGLLNDSHRWTAVGIAFAYIDAKNAASESVSLCLPEQRLFLKCLLTAGGGLVVKFAEWLISRGTTSDDELREHSVVEKLMIEALDEYLKLATDIRDRTAIRRERDRLSRSEYVSSTKRHKRYFLLRALQRVHLLQVEESDGSRTTVAPDKQGRLAALCTAIPDGYASQRVLAKPDITHDRRRAA